MTTFINITNATSSLRFVQHSNISPTYVWTLFSWHLSYVHHIISWLCSLFLHHSNKQLPVFYIIKYQSYRTPLTVSYWIFSWTFLSSHIFFSTGTIINIFPTNMMQSHSKSLFHSTTVWLTFGNIFMVCLGNMFHV